MCPTKSRRRKEHRRACDGSESLVSLLASDGAVMHQTRGLCQRPNGKLHVEYPHEAGASAARFVVHKAAPTMIMHGPPAADSEAAAAAACDPDTLAIPAGELSPEWQVLTFMSWIH
jgi:hypothetical protein